VGAGKEGGQSERASKVRADKKMRSRWKRKGGEGGRRQVGDREVTDRQTLVTNQNRTRVPALTCIVKQAEDERQKIEDRGGRGGRRGERRWERRVREFLIYKYSQFAFATNEILI
jgi:hypothetical protein